MGIPKMMHQQSYRAGYMAAATDVLHLINTFTDRTVDKGKLYDMVMELRPK